MSAMGALTVGAWLEGWPRASLAAAGASPAVRGAGATFPSKLYARWAREYAESGGVTVSYQPTGSGDGVKQATARSVDFGGTDAPLSNPELAQRKLVQIPTCVGGVVPVVNGFEAQRLKLTGELLADIMSGVVERWDDPRIAAVNRGLALPARRIVRVVRADKSGTTEGFTRYLCQMSPAFQKSVGLSNLPHWAGEVQAQEGNDGVSGAVRRTPGAIGYVSHDRVEADKLASVLLRNRAGQFVAASEAGFRAAILNSELNSQGEDSASLLDRDGAATWPLTLASFVLVDAAPATAVGIEPTLRFLYWCFMRGDTLTRGTGFAPLPTAIQAKVAARFAEVRPQDGKRPNFMVV
jgi:phosphate transport system substrate-binding protein